MASCVPFSVKWSLLDLSLACLVPTSGFEVFGICCQIVYVLMCFVRWVIVDSSWSVMKKLFLLGYFLDASYNVRCSSCSRTRTPLCMFEVFF